MSKRAAELLRDDLETKPPMRLADVEAAQKEILTNVRQEFLDNIRQQLSNNTVGLDIRIEEAPVSTAKVYKPSDKFKFLAEKNPALLELKKRFDLELDY